MKTKNFQQDETNYLIIQLKEEVRSLTNNVDILISTTQEIESSQKNFQVAIFDLQKQVALDISTKDDKINLIHNLQVILCNGLNEIKSQQLQSHSSSINEEKLLQLLSQCQNDCNSKGFESINQTLQEFKTLLNNNSQQSSVVSESITSALSLLSDQLNNLSSDMTFIRSEVSDLKQSAEFHRNAMKSIILGVSKVPTLFLIIPDSPIAKMDKLKSLFMVNIFISLNIFSFNFITLNNNNFRKDFDCIAFVL